MNFILGAQQTLKTTQIETLQSNLKLTESDTYVSTSKKSLFRFHSEMRFSRIRPKSSLIKVDDHVSTKISDPARHKLALELRDKHAKTTINQIDFFSPKTNSALTQLPEPAQKKAKQSLAHLSFRSGAYIGVILVYLLMKFLVLTDKERKALWREDYQLRRAYGSDTVQEVWNDWSMERFVQSMKTLDFARFRRPGVAQTSEQPDSGSTTTLE